MPLLITISRQLGSGGAYIGQQLAKKLGVFYADREIIHEVAQKFSLLDEDIESRDEKVLSFWQSFLEENTTTRMYIFPQIMLPTDRKLFEAETQVIKHIANERSAVFIGRCGFHVLHNHLNHIKIFLYGDIEFRKERVQEYYSLSKESAEKMIIRNDKERALYCKTFSGKEWKDAINYDISIDTSKIGVDRTVELILYYLKSIYGDV